MPHEASFPRPLGQPLGCQGKELAGALQPPQQPLRSLEGMPRSFPLRGPICAAGPARWSLPPGRARPTRRGSFPCLRVNRRHHWMRTAVVGGSGRVVYRAAKLRELHMAHSHWPLLLWWLLILRMGMAIRPLLRGPIWVRSVCRRALVLISVPVNRRLWMPRH
jgi:hypothetical protein